MIVDIMLLIGSKRRRGSMLSRVGAERGQTHTDLVAAAGLGNVLEDSPVRLDRLLALARQFLGARQVKRQLLVQEVSRSRRAQRTLEGGSGLGVVLLRLPRVRHAGLRQRPDRGGSPGQRNGVGVPGGRVLPVVET